MHPDKIINTDDTALLKEKLLSWAATFQTMCYFDSNGYTDPYSAFDVLVAAGAKSEVLANAGNAFEQLREFIQNRQQLFVPGFMGYDLKNETEDLQSTNPDHLGFPDLYFFEPEHVVMIRGGVVTISSKDAEAVWSSVENMVIPVAVPAEPIGIKSRFSRPAYIQAVQQLQQHIHRGDSYEVTFCQEFYAENVQHDPLQLFRALNEASPTPFAGFFKLGHRCILSASPERFLSRRGSKLISQPIKGTSRRQPGLAEDELAKQALKNNPKEQAENVMIVDLVRNDLTKNAVAGSVRVEELFGIYSFGHVHQMISTVVCTVDEELNNTQVLKNTFPMGSMTGAPKIRAMQLIEEFERSKRSLFSGTIGYFSPTGDFDFNVVIRSVLYNQQQRYLSFQVGSAITGESIPEMEYEECLLKAEAILSVLNQPGYIR